MTIISELKRRNVFRVAIYYFAVSWIIMQVVDVLTSVLHLPDWTGRLIFVLLAVGLPIALLLGWAFELTPDGLRREVATGSDDASTATPRKKTNYLLYGVIVLVLVDIGWNYARQRAPAAIDPGQIRSIVVLPLDNLMNDSDQDYFVEGMHEALIAQLSKIKVLRVISRTTAMRYAGADKPLPEIASELDVDAAVAGSVLRSGNVVRVTTQLIDARNDHHIWAESFDRELVDILALYSDITREIAHQVRATISPDEQASLGISVPIDPETYELYLKGRHLCGNWSPQEMRRGIESLQQAIELSPDHAASHAQLGMCLVDSAFFEYVRPDEIESRARAAALQAVQLDDRLAEAYVALGSVHYYLEFEPQRAEIQYLRALELNSKSIDTLLRLSWLYAESGRYDDALGPTQRALELDPLSTGVRNAMGQVYYLNRDFDLAIEEFNEALELDRSDPSLHYYLALPFEQKGQYEKSIALLESANELSDHAPLYQAALGHAYARAGMREQALEILDRLNQSEDPSPFNLAVVHLGLGNNDEALELLDEALKAHNFQMLYLKSGPRFDSLRDDSRFVSLLEQMGW